MGIINRLSAVAYFLSALVYAVPSFAAEKELTAVADLRYGSVLYHYHLDEYMEALSELLVAQKQGGISGHGDNPALMEAGLAMGYKMERQASEIFKQVLGENRSTSVSDAAWFYLAKIRYGHNDWARASEALSHVSSEPDVVISEEVNALKINLLVKKNDIASAVALYEGAELGEHWRSYLAFNIGSAFARQQQYYSATVYFDYLAEDLFDDEEYKTLHDKAMTAAGFSYLFLERYEISKEKFSRVRSNSVLANRAMLGYSWAAIELEDFEDAKRVLKHLSDSQLNDENKQEALLALPYTYEKMGQPKPALRAYQEAAREYENEISDIDKVFSQLDESDLLSVLNVPLNEELDWMDLANQQNLSPKLSYLVPLFSQDHFQLSVEHLQDLLYLNLTMDRWLEKIIFYENMLAFRQASRLENTGQVVSEKKRVDEERLAERYTELNLQLQTIDTKQNYLALINDEERDLLQRIEKSEERIERLKETDPFIDEYVETLRRYRGLLLWNAAEGYGDRFWQVKKSITVIESAVLNIEESESRIDDLQVNQIDIQPWYQQLSEGRDEVVALQAKLQRVIEQSESEIIEKIKVELSNKKSSLNNYLSLSRLSIARLHDSAREQYFQGELDRNKDLLKSSPTKKKPKKTNPSLLKVPSLTTLSVDSDQSNKESPSSNEVLQ